MPVPVIQAVHEHYLKEITLGGYEAADRERQWLGDIYGYLAKLIRQSLQISRLWKMLPGHGTSHSTLFPCAGGYHPDFDH